MSTDTVPNIGQHSNGLRAVLEAARLEHEYSLKDLTVLASQNDPFRLDTPAGHRDGEWLAVQAEALGLGARRIHLRGLHYMLVSGEVIKPNGLAYTNTDADWTWMSEKAAKAARWLGYLPFAQVIDARNAEPVIRPYEFPEPESFIAPNVEVEIPDAGDLEPRVQLEGFEGAQLYRLVLIGEKTSLEDVLAPLAAQHQADLYLPAGEPSDTLLHTMAYSGAEDGRRMIVLYLSDCDPAGWQMPVSVARKLQAFKVLEFPELDVDVRRVALSPTQVLEYGLPSTPLKETEKRADTWKREMEVEQTEIDALAALNPALLRQIVGSALAPFYDYTLNRRVETARQRWLQDAQAALEAQVDPERLERLRVDATAKLDSVRAEIDAVNQALRYEVGDDYDLPAIVIPEPEIDGRPAGLPLLDSDDDWFEQTRRLIESRRYEGER